MDAAGAAARFRALDAELAAKSYRVVELEARVSFLEAENARLREALACLAAGDEDPESGRLAAGFLVRGIKRGESAEKPGGSGVCDGVIEVSDDEEEGANVDASSKGRSPEEEGVVADPTPRKRAVWAVTGEALTCLAAGNEDPESSRLSAGFLVRGSKSESAKKPGGSVACGGVIEVSDDEEEGASVGANSKGRSSDEEGVVTDPIPRRRVVTRENENEEDVAEGGVGSSSSRVNSVGGVGLEDDDVLVSPRGRKRAAARLVTSDSEDEDANDGKHGVDDQEEGGKPSKKRGFRGICDSDDEDATEGVGVVTSKATSPVQIESGEDEDDTIPICQVLKKMRKERDNPDDIDDDDELVGEEKGCSTPPTRRSARLVKNQSKGRRAERRVLNFVEPKECEGSEDDIEEDDDMEDFINDEDVESAEESCDQSQVSGTSLPIEESSTGPEESDSVVDYADVMACIGRKNKAKDWKFEGDMLAAFNKHPELCLKAVCALYRRQTEEEQMHKATIVDNKQGFSQIHARKASDIAEFLLDGDLYGPVKKTISELEEYDPSALAFCRGMASNYSKQLFEIYQDKEDPYFHP